MNNTGRGFQVLRVDTGAVVLLCGTFIQAVKWIGEDADFYAIASV